MRESEPVEVSEGGGHVFPKQNNTLSVVERRHALERANVARHHYVDAPRGRRAELKGRDVPRRARARGGSLRESHLVARRAAARQWQRRP